LLLATIEVTCCPGSSQAPNSTGSLLPVARQIRSAPRATASGRSTAVMRARTCGCMRATKPARVAALRLNTRTSSVEGRVVDEVPARLPPGSVESEHAGVGARQDIGADRAGDRRLGAEPVLRGLVEQRQRTYDNALELGGLAVIGDVYTLASLLILLGAAPEREPLDVDEHARHLQPMAAALMHADAAVFVLDADAWRRIGRVLGPVAEAVAHGSDRLLKRDPAFELLCFDEQRHSVVLRPAVHGLGGGLIMACTEPSGRGTTAADVYRARPVVVDARGAVSNRLACTTRLPSMLVTARRNGASTRVPGIGASASSMSRPSDRNLT